MTRISVRHALVAALTLVTDAIAKDWESPAYTWLYQYLLPIPPVKTERW